MNMNDFKYHSASNVELLEHLVSELKDISTDPECITDFDHYRTKTWGAGELPRRCPAGWRSYLPSQLTGVAGNTYLNSAFFKVFSNRREVSSVMLALLGEDWDLIFGNQECALSMHGTKGDGGYADRIEVAERLLNEELEL